MEVKARIAEIKTRSRERRAVDEANLDERLEFMAYQKEHLEIFL